MSYKILQIDGGGIRGIIPAVICNAIEKNKGKRLNDIFDMISGTSTGAIIGGGLAAGISAEDIMNIYLVDGPGLFDPRILINPKRWTEGKYDRTKFQDKIRALVDDITLNDLKTRYVATAFNLSSGRTHFINSTDARDAVYTLLDVISWSGLSAANYFGKINAPGFVWDHYEPNGTTKQPRVGATFQDGGQGINNCTLRNDLAEMMAKDYDDVLIISLGCGSDDKYIPYEKTCRAGFISQIKSFFTQARDESTVNQVLEAKYIEMNRPGIRTFRIDAYIPQKMNELDAVKYIDEFKNIGIGLIGQVPFELL